MALSICPIALVALALGGEIDVRDPQRRGRRCTVVDTGDVAFVRAGLHLQCGVLSVRGHRLINLNRCGLPDVGGGEISERDAGVFYSADGLARCDGAGDDDLAGGVVRRDDLRFGLAVAARDDLNLNRRIGRRRPAETLRRAVRILEVCVRCGDLGDQRTAVRERHVGGDGRLCRRPGVRTRKRAVQERRAVEVRGLRDRIRLLDQLARLRLQRGAIRRREKIVDAGDSEIAQLSEDRARLAQGAGRNVGGIESRLNVLAGFIKGGDLNLEIRRDRECRRAVGRRLQPLPRRFLRSASSAAPSASDGGWWSAARCLWSR